MKESAITVTGRNFWETFRGSIFFVLFYFYLWFGVKPHLIYHGAGEITNFPVFYKGWSFFESVAWHPGGLLEYLSAFLSQFLYYSWAGAVVLTVHAMLTCVFTGCFLKKIGITRFGIISFIPAVLLLITYNRYIYYFTTALAFLTALMFAYFYIRIVSKRSIPPVLLFLTLCVALYLITAGACLYFTLLCAIYEIFLRRRWLMGILEIAVTALVVYVLGILVFNISLLDVYSKLLPFSWEITDYVERKIMIQAVYALYLLLPFVMVMFALCRFLARNKTAVAESKNDDETKSGKAKAVRATDPYKLKRNICFESFFLFIMAAGAVFYFSDSERKAVFKVDYHLNRGEWEKVLEIGRHYQSNDHISHALNRALYHLGLLASDMFCYEQNLRCLMLTSEKEMLSPWNRFGVLYDLGTINQCESRLGESVDMYGERPELLQKLAIIRIAKKDIDTALVYLGALGKTLFYSGWAEDYLRRLQADPDMSTDEQVQRLRSLMPENDVSVTGFSVEKTFLDLLAKNPGNRMAFEYLMARHMLTKELEKFVGNIGRLKGFDYPQIPRCYEEALLAFMYTRKKEVRIAGYQISVQSQERFSRFISTADKYGADEKAAFAELSQKFGDTYFLYYVYAFSGITE